MIKGPPHSEEAEMGVLGSMLHNRASLTEGLDRVTPDHFYNPVHRSIFLAFGEMYRQEKAIDIITFCDALDTGIRIEKDDRHPGYMLKTAEVGGRAYITGLFTFVPTAANIAYYIDIVREKHIARQIIARCGEIIRVAHDEQTEVGALLEEAQSTLTQIIIETERPDIIRHVGEGLEVTVEQLEHAYKHRGQLAIHGLATGIKALDRMTSGLRAQQLVIVGARPSQGKTALAMNFAANMAVTGVPCDCKAKRDTCPRCGGTGRIHVPVGVFSMEMSFQEVVNRLFCSVTDVSLQRFRDGFLTDFMSNDFFQELEGRAGEIGKAPLWIDDSPALSIANFKARSRLMRTRFGVQAIVVDYLQLMRSPSKRAQEARWLEITEISASLKAVAKELEIPVICCAQLNREAEQREFGKPKLSDLRESGSIEQDADVVLLLWRPERHIQHPKNEDVKSEKNKLAKLLGLKDKDGANLWRSGKKDEEDPLTKGQIAERTVQINEFAELILAKQRNGPVGDIRLRFVPDLTRFENLANEKDYSNNPEEQQQKVEDPF